MTDRPARRAPRRGVLLVVSVVLVGVLVAALVHWSPWSSEAVPHPVTHPAPDTSGLEAATPGATPHEPRVFAHYLPAYPISIDNKPPDQDYYAVDYQTIDGEGGIHSAYGGLLRDRPEGREPLPGDWRLADMRTEIRQAKSVGIDGFTLDILALSGRTWDIGQRLMKAADLEGDFPIIPTLDVSSVHDTPDHVASAVATLFAHPSAYTIDGDHVLASFLAEAEPVSWWSDVLERVGAAGDPATKLIAVFNDPSPDTMRAFAPISYGEGSWGYRSAAGAEAAPDLAARAHALGVEWMQAVAVQDARPRAGAYAEAGNTETLRATWSRAITDQADLVQIATWNDYSETTAIAPSQHHGDAFLKLCGYYAAWFRDGVPPPLNRDHLILTHRAQPWDARATSGIDNMQPTLGGSTVAPRDTVEALVFLIAPATVTVTSGPHTTTVERPAGISAVDVQLGAGRPSAQITRDAKVVMSVVSPYPVVSAPVVQDLEYDATGS